MSNNLSLTTLNPDKVWSNVSVQRQLTSWVWVNTPVDSVPNWEKEQNNLCQTTYHSQHSILTRYDQMYLYKGNLPAEYELVHQFIVYQVGKRNKIIMSNNLPLTTLNPDKLRSNVSIQRQLTSWVWVSAPVHSVTNLEKVQIIMSNNLLLTTLNPDKVRSNVSVQRQLTRWVWVSVPVHSVPSWEKEQNNYVKQLIAHNTQSWQSTVKCVCTEKTYPLSMS